ncbi:phytoene desaturase family protein [Streptomyces sp. NPDC101393]|uniref:phytoene desaturase family protein n=1 Tax=Streptomyces sp. NPDC101393 TaxID=3366141 RepID=UPI0037F40622
MSGAPQASYDAIIVGSGIGGLVCAGYLAASGRRVLVLEQHDVAGGNSQVFRRRGAFEFDVGVHYLGDCGPDGILPAVLRGLGLADRVRFRELDPDGFDVLRFPGTTVRVPAGWQAYTERMCAAFPGDADGIRTFTGICARLGAVQRDSLLAPSGPGDGPQVPAGAPPRVLRWARRPLAALFAHCALSVRARTALAAQSGNYGAPPSGVDVAGHVAVLDHYLRGASYPEGGGQQLAAALVEALEAAGGELRTRTRVERILVEDGRAAGVRLADGSRVQAPLVISGADYLRTVLDLTGPEHFPPQYVRRARTAHMRYPVSVLYAALAPSFPRPVPANLWWHRGWDIDAAYEELSSGRPRSLPFVFVSTASAKDPGAPHTGPPGYHNLQIMSPCAPGFLPGDAVNYRRDPAYRAEKARMRELLLDAAESALGPVRAHLVHAEYAGALTHQRFTGSSGGTPYGLSRWGRQGARPDHRTPVPGLFVVGQSGRYGSGITGVAISGIQCASHLLHRSLLPEVHAGEVLLSPGLLPARGPGWDALRVSRGAARSALPGLAPIGRPLRPRTVAVGPRPPAEKRKETP